MKVIEALFVAAFTAFMGFIMIYFIPDCRDIDTGTGAHPVQVRYS